jgi:transcriptional regulator with XRE-family HTH domain
MNRIISPRTIRQDLLREEKNNLWRDRWNFGLDVLRKKRIQKPLNQQQMAELVGLDQTTVSRIEAGGEKPRDVVTALAICQFYGLDPEERDKFFIYSFGLPYSKIMNHEIEKTSGDEFIFKIDNDLAQMKILIESGSPEVSSDLIKRNILPFIYQRIIRSLNVRNKETELLVDRYAYALLFMNDANSFWMNRTQSANDCFSKVTKLKNLMNLTKINIPKAIVGSMEASGYYLRGNSIQALTVASSGVKAALEMGIEDPHVLWGNLSLWVVNSAKAGFDKEARAAMEKADRLLNSKYMSPNISHKILETDARIDGILGLGQFSKKQEMARNKVFDKEGVVEDRYIAMLINRNELEALNKMGDIDLDHIEKLVNDSKLISGNDYRRILDEINMLALQLNSKREKVLKSKKKIKRINSQE